MYICNDCGCEFNEPKKKATNNMVYGNALASGTIIDNTCPCCDSSDYDYIIQCSQCQQGFAESNICSGLCEDCLEENATAYTAVKFGEINKAEIEINGFLVSVFDESEIERCLWNCFLTLPQFAQEKYAKDFCLEDNSSFGYFLKQLEAEK